LETANGNRNGASANGHRYVFDDFEVDPANRTCRRGGEAVPMTGRVFDILLVFAENPGRLLKKDELIERVWAGDSVEDGNLARNVSTLRRALGDDAKEHKYIATVQGQGYRFLADVAEVSTAATVAVSDTVTQSAQVAQPPVAVDRRRFSSKWLWAISLVIAIVAVAWVVKARLFTPTGQIKSLAILPLKPLDGGENYLGAGIADAVIRRISQTGQVTVRPTSAVLRYLHAETDALTAARQLSADAILEGTTQRAGDRLRVSVNLLRSRDGASLWADSFDVRMSDIFTIQDQVAQQVAARLRLQLNPEQQARFNKRPTSNPVAYEYYVRGVYSFDQRGWTSDARPQMEATIDLFKKAIEVDPNYALAHAQLAYAYVWKAILIDARDATGIDRAKEEIERAQALDPQLAETHLARHLLLWSAYEGWQVEAAVRELLQAQQLNPNIAHDELADIYYHMGLEDLGARELQRALEIDPTNEHVKNQVVDLNQAVHKYDEYLAAMQIFFPNQPLSSTYLLGKGRLADAQREIEKLAAEEPNNPILPLRKGLLFALQGNFREAEALVPLILSKKADKYLANHHTTYTIACIYALAGNSTEAVKWLRETAATGFPNYPLFERDPYLSRIRQAPEFLIFMAELKARWESYRQEFVVLSPID